MLATWDLTKMPEIAALRDRLHQMAALCAVLAVDYGESQYEFYPRWNGSQLAAISDGRGDELFVRFLPAGCLIKGFAHESQMTPYKYSPPRLWPRLFDGLPSALAAALNHAVFDKTATTFVIWRLADQDSWSTCDIDYCEGTYRDGSADLLSPLLFTSSDFAAWLAENYEVDVDQSIVAAVFDHAPLTDMALLMLNSNQPLQVLRDAVKKTGYPLARPL